MSTLRRPKRGAVPKAATGLRSECNERRGKRLSVSELRKASWTVNSGPYKIEYIEEKHYNKP